MSLAASTAAVHYRIDPTQTHAHLYRVTLTVAVPAAQQELSLPVWIPGSYLVREFSKNLQSLQAQQGGAPVPLQQLDKHRWRAQCTAGTPLVLNYEVAAYDTSVRTAWLDATRGFFNGTSLCLRVHGQEDAPHTLEVACPPALAGWSLATGLEPVEVAPSGFGLYRARNYDELVDCPVEMGPFWSAQFTACGVAHQLVVAGAAPSLDGERLLRDVQRICEEAIRFWHGAQQPPFTRYVFLLNVVHDGYGGLEHGNSTALICGRRDLPRVGDAATPEGYTTLLGLISHEYFHTWNVKRLRPAEFARYDYTRENYTELLWFFEGFTSYYDDLLLRRAGLVDHATYLRLLTKNINQMLQTPGRQVQSVAQASFDAWVKYYRQDENTPNSTVSYYTKGALVGLCLDLALRREGRTTLDDVMRALWQRTGGGPMAETDLLAVLQELSGRDWSGEIGQWAHGTAELPLAELLAAHGIRLQAEPAQIAQRLGLRVNENHGVHIKTVLRGGAAEAAGFMAGDEWLALETPGQAWRLHKLDDVPLYAASATQITALVARDQRLMRLALTLPGAGAASDTVRLDVQDAAAAQRWLGPAQPGPQA
ncbi:M61 family metallopeptidase [Diaphorobacter sp. C33]|uniref:Metalloprotease with PDZ domain n=1 Tax=Diaphorobacter nitroreducens TaxID=164759 RepID=A0AAX1WT47_9BURK|nr:M61 family metallopeptidase [Diaphorobacter sp. C33]ROR41658.1 putative metalloprotease with PDZ domain [Diaphorobacter nitroreducens]WKK88409.1 M61 family metallopeptidase [Diaphorobacter sp. C33]